MMINNVTIGGKLIADAELRYCSQDSITCTSTLANNRKCKEIENLTYTEVSLFGSFANAVYPCSKKGTSVDMVGELAQDTWEHEGKTYSEHRIKAKKVDFRAPKKGEQTIPNIEKGENYEGS